MRPLVYALCFTGRAIPAGPDGSVLALTATAPGVTLVATVGPAGLAGSLRPAAGGEAALVAEVTLTGATSFQAIGTITVGDGHWLRCATVGSGHLGAATDPALRHGSAMWRVEGGAGQFAGASGLITSNFVLSDGGAVTDHQLGVIFMRDPLASQDEASRSMVDNDGKDVS